MSDKEKREGKIKTIITDAASDFLTRESNHTSLITVTRVELVDRGSQVIIYFTVFPSDKEEAALDFVKRKRSEFKEFLKSKTKLGHIPFVDFMIDVGEKNRQRIEEIIDTDAKRSL